MLARASTDDTFWSGFWDYLWRRPPEAKHVELDASYSEELLRNWVADVAARYDNPASAAGARLDISFRRSRLHPRPGCGRLPAGADEAGRLTVEFKTNETEVERPGLDTLKICSLMPAPRSSGGSSAWWTCRRARKCVSTLICQGINYLESASPCGPEHDEDPAHDGYFRWLVDIYPLRWT